MCIQEEGIFAFGTKEAERKRYLLDSGDLMWYNAFQHQIKTIHNFGDDYCITYYK